MNFKIFSVFILIAVAVLGGALLFNLVNENESKVNFTDYKNAEKNIENGDIKDLKTSNSSANLKNQSSQKTSFQELSAKILKEGKGKEVAKGDKVTVHYVGELEDGTVFDSSRKRGKPFSFTVGAGKVIPGWELGVVGMKKGEKRRLFIPSKYAYGKKGVEGAIPPSANLIFDIELLGVKKK